MVEGFHAAAEGNSPQDTPKGSFVWVIAHGAGLSCALPETGGIRYPIDEI